MPHAQSITRATRRPELAALSAVALTLTLALAPRVAAQCQPIVNGDFESGLKGWSVDPQNTQTGQASASSDGQAVDSEVVGPPLSGQAASLTAFANALGGPPGVANQALASITLSTQTVATDRYLNFDGFGSWEMKRWGAGTGMYELRIEVEDDDGDIAARTLSAFGSPPPLTCGMGMSILGIVASMGPFTLDVLFNGDQPSGINLGDDVTLRLSLQCSAGAVVQNCDETHFGIAMFVDGFRFCPQPDGCPDSTGDGEVNVDDLIAVILAWGACPPPTQSCPADDNVDGVVDVDDLIAVILGWGCASFE